MPFAIIVTEDYGDVDNASQLNRPDVFRLNIGVGRDTFRSLFGAAPGEQSDQRASCDYAALDRLLPRPVYAPQPYVCVLNPSADTFEAVKPLLADAYGRVATRHARLSRHCICGQQNRRCASGRRVYSYMVAV